MSVSAIVMGLFGLAGTFLPDEILILLGISKTPLTMILLQMIGGLYLGFALLNWFTRSARIGGIYSRPVVLGNMMHFIVVAFALIRQLFEQFTIIFGIMAAIYLAFAISFGLVLLSNPIKNDLKKAA